MPTAALFEAIPAAVVVGDLHAARVAHEAIGRFIAQPVSVASAVADLGVERAKRGGP